MNFYEGLSEHAHPNAHGMVLLYTDRHHEGVTYFTERNDRRAKASLILALGALATSLDVIEYALAQHLKLSERLAILAERGIYERGTWPDETLRTRSIEEALSCRFSPRSFVRSARSAVVRPSVRVPASRSAWATQLLIVCADRSNDERCGFES